MQNVQSLQHPCNSPAEILLKGSTEETERSNRTSKHLAAVLLMSVVASTDTRLLLAYFLCTYHVKFSELLDGQEINIIS